MRPSRGRAGYRRVREPWGRLGGRYAKKRHKITIWAHPAGVHQTVVRCRSDGVGFHPALFYQQHPTYYGDSKWCSASGCTNSQLSSSSGGSCAYGSLARDEVLPMRYFFVYVGSGLIRLKCCISPRSPARPTGSVYSGTLSGMRARLYLNSMVAFSAALSAAPRWNEPAWVGVSRGPGGGGGCPWASWRAAAHLLAP
jgi:hypothetical protein